MVAGPLHRRPKPRSTSATDHPEFDAWAWVEPDELLELIVPFKRSVYEAVVAEFLPLLTAFHGKITRHAGPLQDHSEVTVTLTSMPRKSFRAPNQSPLSGHAWVGSRVTATRISPAPPMIPLVGSNSTHPAPGR